MIYLAYSSPEDSPNGPGHGLALTKIGYTDDASNRQRTLNADPQGGYKADECSKHSCCNRANWKIELLWHGGTKMDEGIIFDFLFSEKSGVLPITKNAWSCHHGETEVFYRENGDLNPKILSDIVGVACTRGEIKKIISAPEWIKF